jgi:hypothetical protein
MQMFGEPVRDLAFLRQLLVYVSDHGGGTLRWPECELTSCASCQAAYLLDAIPEQGALVVIPEWATEPDREWRLVPTGSLERVMGIEPEDHATKSRDYGRGFAEAVRLVREALS